MHKMEAGLQVVVGLGITGLSVVRYLLAQGCSVAVTDSRNNPPNADELPAAVRTSFGEIDAALLLDAAQIIISPGLARETPAIQAAIDKGIKVVGDVHLLGQAIQAMPVPIPMVAITGSNAKSTVTTLVGDMASAAGIKVAVGGNLGRPALDLLTDEPDLIVLEVSSFQLESTSHLAANVATILNISADHLDRHHDMQGYCTAKQRIFEGAQSVVINRADKLTQPQTPAVLLQGASTLSFGGDTPTEQDYGVITEARIDGKRKLWLVKGSDKLIAADELKIKGKHNLLNALAAMALAERVNVPRSAMLDALKAFKGLPHRCEFVASVNGIDYFNDSKGTNVGSTLAAINGLGESYDSVNDNKKIHVILGGEGKGQDFAPLTDALQTYASSVLLIGRDASLIAQHVPNAVATHQVETIDNALKHLSSHAKAGDVILLSPACASFDQFTSYVKRGEHFVSLVLAQTNTTLS